MALERITLLPSVLTSGFHDRGPKRSLWNWSASARNSVTTATALAVVLLSCSELRRPAEQSSTTGPMGQESTAELVRAPLAPPGDYSSPLPLTSPAPFTPYGNPANETTESPTLGQDGWRVSPSWAAIKGDGCVEVIEGEGGKHSVKNCPKEDVEAERRGGAFGVTPE